MPSTNENDNDEMNLYSIHEAVFEGDFDKILSLLEKGHDIDVVNDCGQIPIVLAVIHKQYDILKLLLNHDADPYAPAGTSDTLLLATSHADEEAVQILLGYKCDPSHQGHSNLWTPLHDACHKGLTSILEKFVRTNCNLDVRNEEDATPLYISCQYGQKECLQLLLNYGANAELFVDTEDTPLHIACQEGHSDCVATLLNHGVNMDCLNCTDRTPLAVACLYDQYNCAKLLIDNHASLINDMSNESSPIHLAASNRCMLCLSLLTENGADVNSVCGGYTPLYEAVNVGNLLACKMLLSKGADPNCVCEAWPSTPLMTAARENHVDIIKELVSHGADVNQATSSSPLTIAARCLNFEALERLLRYNVDINYVDEFGNSGLSILCQFAMSNTYVFVIDSDDTYDELCHCIRNILISGGNIAPLFIPGGLLRDTDALRLRTCSKLIRLLLEFATCEEHIQFLATICEMFSEEEEWEPLYGFLCRPRKLTHLCRIRIRCLLGETGLRRIDELPVPAPVKDYLRHSEDMTFD